MNKLKYFQIVSFAYISDSTSTNSPVPKTYRHTSLTFRIDNGFQYLPCVQSCLSSPLSSTYHLPVPSHNGRPLHTYPWAHTYDYGFPLLPYSWAYFYALQYQLAHERQRELRARILAMHEEQKELENRGEVRKQWGREMCCKEGGKSLGRDLRFAWSPA
jgi:hypothetical protein